MKPEINGDAILKILSQALPKVLNTIVFSHDVTISNNSLESLMKN